MGLWVDLVEVWELEVYEYYVMMDGQTSLGGTPAIRNHLKSAGGPMEARLPGVAGALAGVDSL